LGEGKVIALPDINHDGIADRHVEVLTGLHRPHGLAFFGSWLFVAEENQLVRYHWDETNLKAIKDKVLFSFPSGGFHFTRTVYIDTTGKLFVSVGSSCNACKEPDPRWASVLVSDVTGAPPVVYASGLRNTVFFTPDPTTGELWGNDMGRDNLGDHLPPDELNILREGKNYGWPNCYGDKVVDTEFGQGSQRECNGTEAPVWKYPAHVAPLGLVFIHSAQFPSDWQGDILVAEHGSWNSSTPVGYKVVHLHRQGQQVVSSDDFLTGWLQGSSVLGRPVDLVFNSEGTLFLSDDQDGLIYEITGKK
jgi:glucose/arabinose dehydrogenase